MELLGFSVKEDIKTKPGEWEFRFDQMFKCDDCNAFHFHHGLVPENIKAFIRTEIERTKDLERMKTLTAREIAEFIASIQPQHPMGVSQWKEHGKKYGYWAFFEKEIADKYKGSGGGGKSA